MSSISQCQYDIKKYNTLKSKVNSVISALALTINDSNNISNSISNRYQINDDSAPIVFRVNQLKDDIKETHDYLKFKVIPAIDSAISGLNQNIKSIEREEQRRQEQRRIEEEQKKKEEEKKKKEEEEKRKKEEQKRKSPYRRTSR